MFRKFGSLATGVVRRRALTLIPATVTGPAVARDAAVCPPGGDLLPGTELCRLPLDPALAPAELDPTLVRHDITEGRPGVATLVRIQVVDAENRPLANARVDLWQCDAGGCYAAAAAPEPGTFLRGTQFSDGRGIVEFVTIYPGRGKGPSARVHFVVTPAVGTGDGAASGDILFPETVSTFVYETAAAYRGAVAAVPDSPPAVAADLPEAGESYLAQVIVGIDAAGAIRRTPATVH
jgi:hypothetical protein